MCVCVRAGVVLIVSYPNFIGKFNENQPCQLELPNQWLWDIIDEFIYQVCTVLLYLSVH